LVEGTQERAGYIRTRGIAGRGKMIDYLTGLLGMWLACDGIISIRLYPEQSWLKDHSIRLIRIAIGIYMMIIGGIRL